MAVYGVTGKLYFGSITHTDGTGGTLVDDVQAREIPVLVSTRVSMFRTGREQDQVDAIWRGVKRIALAIRGRDITANTLLLMFKEITASGGFKSSGATVRGQLARVSTTRLLIKPNVATEKTFYMPNAAIFPPESVQLIYSPSQSYLNDQEVLFVATRQSEDSEPGAMYDTAANVAATYDELTG